MYQIIYVLVWLSVHYYQCVWIYVSRNDVVRIKVTWKVSTYRTVIASNHQWHLKCESEVSKITDISKCPAIFIWKCEAVGKFAFRNAKAVLQDTQGRACRQ